MTDSQSPVTKTSRQNDADGRKRGSEADQHSGSTADLPGWNAGTTRGEQSRHAGCGVRAGRPASALPAQFPHVTEG